MVRIRGTTTIALALLIAIAWAFNFTKPIHVDDTAYLRMAAHVAQAPLDPMGLMLNWGGESRRAFDEMNQPPLFFYVLAAVRQVSPSWEIAGHVTLAIASAAAILFCFGVARRVAPRAAVLVTAACALGPAFLPAQNVMTDVPLLACWLGAIYFLLRAGEGDAPSRDYAMAGLAAAIASLVKYKSLGLLAAVAVVVVTRRHRSGVWALAIPVAALAAWSIWNVELYGRAHLLARSVPAEAAAIAGKAVDWTSGLGLTLPWAWLVLARRPFGRRTTIAAGLAVACAIGIFAVMRVDRLGDTQAALVTAILVANGVAALAGVAGAVAAGLGREASPIDRDRTLVLVSWLAGAAGFAIVLAPFMAIRHVLLAVPPIALLVIRHHGPWLQTRPVAVGVVMLTALPGAALAAADYAWAAVYPRAAAELAVKYPAPPASIVAVGHWGWQWYAGQRGWQEYDAGRTVLKPGGYVFEPKNVTRPLLSREHTRQLVTAGELRVPVSALTFLRTAPLYSYSWRMGLAPLAFNRAPIETVTVLAVRPD